MAFKKEGERIMIFYRLMSKEEFKNKKIHNNKNHFDESINTHKYEKGKNYIHLFLNAESCFESFDKVAYNECLIGMFDIPDRIVCKYGIGLGGYDFLYNAYSTNYRYPFVNNKNNYAFWLPEIAIKEEDFDYSWCIKKEKAGKEKYKGYLPFEFETDLVAYREIINDGYLYGYSNKDDLLKKYKELIKIKKRIMKILSTTKKINIIPRYFNEDSLLATKILIKYAIDNNFIKDSSEIFVSLNKKINSDAINIADIDLGEKKNLIINRNTKHSNPSFCATLDALGINVDKRILYTITPEKDVIYDYSLVKRLDKKI